MPANLENSAVGTGMEKISFHSHPKERQCQRMLKYCTIALISHASKVMLKILQASFNSMWTVNFQMFKLNLEKAGQAAFRKSRGTRDQIANIHWIIKKQESSRKHLLLLYWLLKPLTVWITMNCGKFFKRWEYETTLPASWEIFMQVKKHQLELDTEQQTGFTSG